MDNKFEEKFKEIHVKAESGDSLAQAYLAQEYSVREQHEEAWHWAYLSAGNGNAWGLYELGMCYLKGINTEVDLEKAYILFNEAVEKGCPRGYIGLAGIVEKVSDMYNPEIYRLIAKAVQLGDAKAYYLLGLQYKYGFFVEKSVNNYAYLTAQAGSKGFAPAFYELACESLPGGILNTNIDDAMQFMKFAAHLGFPPAIDYLEKLDSQNQ